jgi:hypothetical protein
LFLATVGWICARRWSNSIMGQITAAGGLDADVGYATHLGFSACDSARHHARSPLAMAKVTGATLVAIFGEKTVLYYLHQQGVTRLTS